MQKKKVVKKTNKKVIVRAIPKLENSSSYSWIWYLIGALIIIAALYFIYSSMTGNVITGNAVDTKNSFKPIVDMVSGLISSVYDALKGPLEAIVGDTSGGAGVLASSEDVFFAKVLLLLLLLAMVSSILSMVGGIEFLKEGWTHWVVSIAVSILAVRFLNADLVQAILIPYSTFGVVISSVLPFVIYFIFVEKGLKGPEHAIIRRVAWIFFAIVFLAIYIMRVEDFTEGIVAVIYPLVALLSFLMAIADGTIQKIMNGWKQSKAKAYHNAQMIHKMSNLQSDKTIEFNNALASGVVTRYTGGSLLGIVDAKYHPSTSADSGSPAHQKDMEALAKYIGDLQ